MRVDFIDSPLLPRQFSLDSPVSPNHHKPTFDFTVSIKLPNFRSARVGQENCELNEVMMMIITIIISLYLSKIIVNIKNIIIISLSCFVNNQRWKLLLELFGSLSGSVCNRFGYTRMNVFILLKKYMLLFYLLFL